MIHDLLMNHGGALGTVAYLVTLLLEDYLGKAAPLGARSLIKFLPAVLNYLFTFFKKGAPAMTIQTQSAPVAKETSDVVTLVLALARDVKAGTKPAEVAGKELGLVMAAIQDSDQILVELKADPIAWYRTVFAGFGELIAILAGAAK